MQRPTVLHGNARTITALQRACMGTAYFTVIDAKIHTEQCAYCASIESIALASILWQFGAERNSS